MRPPFLDGKIIHTSQLETVSVVRDPSSDLANVARKGSEIVRVKREIAEREKVFWGIIKANKKNLQVAGTSLGNIMGVQKERSKNGVFDLNFR